jgi:sugar phosphate isomerase/epimerase
MRRLIVLCGPLLVSMHVLLGPVWSPASEAAGVAGAAADAVPDGAASGDHPLFARSNLLAWCIVPYDSRHRGPAERLAMLDQLGIRQYVWDWREQHLKDLPEEIRLSRASRVRLRGVWLWIDEQSDRAGRLGPANRAVMDAVNAGGVPVEYWVGLHDNVFEGLDDAARVTKGAALFAFLRDQAAASGSTVALYNHGGWFGDPDNQMRIIEAAGPRGLGIVFNFHHAYADAHRFPELLPRMLPYLRAVNLSGVIDGTREIVPIGRGTREREMIRILEASGYAGPIGIIGHTEGEDVERALRRNLRGLERLLQ